jgi:hypothetical protein
MGPIGPRFARVHQEQPPRADRDMNTDPDEPYPP